MKTYNATFTGRNCGAIGIMYLIKTMVRAETPEDARLALHERYEHIMGLKLELVEG